MEFEKINWELIAKYLTGECSNDEIALIQQWMNANPENAKNIIAAQKIWNNASIEQLPNVPSEKMWQLINQKTKSKTKIINYGWLRYAAIFLILLGGTWLFYFVNNKNQKNEWIVVNSTGDSIINLQLPDESTVWLNKNSSISYPSKFTENMREAKLDGEAYFEIKHNEKKHFKVYSGKTIVEVLGTSFNLKHNRTSGDVTLMVISGKVLFAHADSIKHSILITAGETANYSASKFSKINHTDENEIAWKTGKYIFNDLPLDSVINILKKNFKTSIVIKNESLKTLKISAEFEKNTLDEILQVIALTLKISIHKENQQYIFNQNN